MSVVMRLLISRTWSKWHRTRRCHCLRKSGNFASASSSPAKNTPRRRRVVLTGVGNRLVVLDRLCAGNASVKRRKREDGAQSHLLSLEKHNTHHCAGCGSSPRSLWLSNKSPVVKQLQFGDRSLGEARQNFGRAWKPYEGGVWVQSAKISHGGAATIRVAVKAGLPLPSAVAGCRLRTASEVLGLPHAVQCSISRSRVQSLGVWSDQFRFCHFDISITKAGNLLYAHSSSVRGVS